MSYLKVFVHAQFTLVSKQNYTNFPCVKKKCLCNYILATERTKSILCQNRLNLSFLNDHLSTNRASKAIHVAVVLLPKHHNIISFIVSTIKINAENSLAPLTIFFLQVTHFRFEYYYVVVIMAD